MHTHANNQVSAIENRTIKVSAIKNKTIKKEQCTKLENQKHTNVYQTMQYN